MTTPGPAPTARQSGRFGDAARLRRSITRAVALGGLTLLYVIAGKLGLAFALVHPSATAVWPPAGIAVGSLLAFGLHLWPAVFGGAFVVNITTAGSVATSLGIALGNTLEAVIGAALVRRFAGGRAAFDRPQDILRFVGLAGCASTAVSATIGVASLAVAGYAPWTEVGLIWLTWWLGDFAGILLVAPVVVLWSGGGSPVRLPRGRWLEAAGLVAALLGLGSLIFAGGATPEQHAYPLTFLCLPVLLWAAFRFGPPGTSLAVLLLSATAVSATTRGLGPFARYASHEALLLLQAFMATAALTMLPVAALVQERRRVQEGADRSEGRLRLAVEAASMGTWEWEIATGRVQWSPSLEALHGLPPGGFRGTHEAFLADVHPDDRERVAAAMQGALQSGRHAVTYRIVRPDGAVRWVEGRGELVRGATGQAERMVGLCMDVTERMRLLEQEQGARERAEEAERRFAVLADLARSITGSLHLDTVLQRIVEGAQVLCRSQVTVIFLRDGESQTLVARHRLGAGAEGYRMLSVLGATAETGSPGATCPAIRTSGEVGAAVPPELRAVAEATGIRSILLLPILFEGEAMGCLYLGHRGRDFTAEDEAVCRALAEQAAIAIHNARQFARQETARAEAVTASRAKDAFLAMLAHELRNPLSAISNAVHVLGFEQPAEGHAAAREVIGRQVGHLVRLVDDLLDVSRVIAGKIALQRQALDLAAAARRAVEVMEVRDGRGPRVTIAAESVWILADPTRLDQILANLLGNAVKYTPPEGAITVTVGQEGADALLRVQDTGMGIPPDLLPQLFELFVQGDRSPARTEGGLGVGLTLVRHLVELHGGAIAAASDGPGQGSTFTVRLPTIAPPPGSHRGSLPPARGRGARRVLLVEDNADARAMLAEVLTLEGHEVHEAADGPHGVEQAIRLRPDLTLVDIGLPGFDGHEVALRIRRDPAGATLRLVALTGYGRPEDREQALASGYDLHLVKPVDPAILLAILADAAGDDEDVQHRWGRLTLPT